MLRIRLFGLVLPVLMVVTALASTGFAQKQRYLRWVGYGISDGYHVANPGPNSDYYNPYTEHNSALWIQRNDSAPMPMTGPSNSVSSISKYPRFKSPTRRPSKRNTANSLPSIRKSENSFQPAINKTKAPVQFKPSVPTTGPKSLPNEFSTLNPQRSPQPAAPISIARSLPSPKSSNAKLESVVIAGGIK